MGGGERPVASLPLLDEAPASHCRGASHPALRRRRSFGYRLRAICTEPRDPTAGREPAGAVYTPGVRILIADDHSLFRDGLRSLLQAQGHEIAGEAKNGREAIALTRELKPDLVLMDVQMPELDGIEATRLIVSEMPEMRVVILTASEEEAKLFEAIKSGAQGYLLKNLEAEAFFEMLEKAQRGEPALTPTLARKLLQEFARPVTETTPPRSEEESLTAREREVLELMVEGVTSNRKLAKRLGLSENTVKFHVRNILDKLRLHNRAEVVGYALRHGIVEPKGD
jgi:DNA-binding NarL/FixJ family response regulator